MNIILFPSLYLPKQSGVPLLTQGLANAYVAKGHRVVIVTPKLDRAHPSFEIINGIEVHRMAFVHPWHILRRGSREGLLRSCVQSPIDLQRLVRLMDQREVTVVNIHSLAGPHVSFLLFALLFTHRHLVVSLHADKLLVSRGLRRFVLRSALRRAERVTAISTRVAAEAAQFCPEASNKIIKIPNGVPVDEFGGRACVAFPSRYILSLARLHPLKGHDVLLAAFQKVAEREKDVHLIIAGDGSQRARLRAVTLALNLTGRVTFLGEVGREKVKDLLAGCELLVLSSWAEGMPLAALEAMASGKAVIGTDVGALSEIVSDSEAGLLVPPGDPHSLADAILSLLWNSDRRKAMGGKGRDFAKARHDFSEIADRYLDVYQKALQNGIRRSRNASRAKGRPGKHVGKPL